MTWIAIALALAAVNLYAFMRFGVDKARAQAGQRRISEADLLFFAMIGGTLGAYAGRAYFRHKTRKAGFSLQLHLITMVQTGILLGLGWLWLTAP
jgi:uncharacterized membrane protein YsdA (DUF1294 family)